jgi:AraC family transcriptional regulator
VSLIPEPTLGHPLRRAEVSGFSVAEVAYPPGATFARHAHERSYLLFVLRGSFVENVGGRADAASSASVVVMPAGTSHVNRFGMPGAQSLLVTLEAEMERRLIAVHRVSPGWRIVARGEAPGILARAYRAFRLDDGRELLTFEELLHAFFAALHATPDERTTSSGPVRKAIELLRDESPGVASLRRIAAEAGCDPSYLCRAFRLHTGCTMGEYARQLRAKKAAELIASSSNSLADVALACGFSDQSHLTRLFRACYGMTPGAYRTMAAA